MRDRRPSLAARLGNFNDKHSSHDTRREASLRWRVVDRIVSLFYRRGF